MPQMLPSANEEGEGHGLLENPPCSVHETTAKVHLEMIYTKALADRIFKKHWITDRIAQIATR